MIQFYDHLEADRITSSIYFQDWIPMSRGEIMNRKDLALMYQLLAKYGEDVFYRGEIANKIVELMESKNGLIGMDDLRNYKALFRDVVKAKFRNFEMLVSQAPSSGGIALIELLKILEKLNIKNHSLNSGTFIHCFIEAFKFVFKDRAQYLHDGRQSETVDFVQIFSEKKINNYVKRIDSTKITSNDDLIVPVDETGNAANISIIDDKENAISISLTLNEYFGSGITLENYGILFNNAMNNFSRDSTSSNSLAPGERPQTSLSPTILLRNKKPFLVIGASGGERIISSLAQIIIDVIYFNLSLKSAIEKPRFFYNYNNHTVEIEQRIGVNSIEYLKNLGYKIELKANFDIYFGNVQAVLHDQINHKIESGSDVRKEGVVYIE